MTMETVADWKGNIVEETQNFMRIYQIASCHSFKTSSGNSEKGLTLIHCDPILLHDKSTVKNKIENVIPRNNNFYDIR